MGLVSSTTFVPVAVASGLPTGLLGLLEGPSLISFFFIFSSEGHNLFLVLLLHLLLLLPQRHYQRHLLSLRHLLVHPASCRTIDCFLLQILSAPWWAPIVLERSWNQENDALLVGFWSALPSLLNALFLHISPLYSSPT